MTNGPRPHARVYRGRQHQPPGAIVPDDWEEFTITVQPAAGGPTERRAVSTLYQLDAAAQLGGFGWGYNGGGTSCAATAILADALDLGDPVEVGMAMESWPPDDQLAEMREDFCAEVLTDLEGDWLLHRKVVLRWAHSWYTQHGLTPPPAASLG